FSLPVQLASSACQFSLPVQLQNSNYYPDRDCDQPDSPAVINRRRGPGHAVINDLIHDYQYEYTPDNPNSVDIEPSITTDNQSHISITD
ncbi:MAG: hypothetical protein OSA89_08405, partial [Mariniblastus sp.]|nr:hypothetical protein [Mariniblastus sp.]